MVAYLGVPSVVEAAIAFRSAASTNQNGQANSITIARPTGTAKGDVLIAVIAVRPNTVTITAPTGFALVNRQNNTTGNPSSVAVYSKVATVSEPVTYTFTFSANTGNAGGIMAFSGVDNASPINVSGGSLTTTTTTTIAGPSLTTTVANTMIIAAREIASSSTWTPPAGMTEVIDVASLATPNDNGLALEGSYKTQAAIGATGTLSATAAGNPDTGTAITLALRPVVCGAVAADPDAFAATAQSGQVILYWSSASPVVVLQKTSAFGSEAPASGVSYAVNDTIGTATVVCAGTGAGTTLAATNSTTYYYMAFTRTLRRATRAAPRSRRGRWPARLPPGATRWRAAPC